MAEDAVGGRTKTKYRKRIDDATGKRIFTDPQGNDLSEDELRSKEGDYTTTAVTQSQDVPGEGILSGSSKKYYGGDTEKKTDGSSLGSMEKGKTLKGMPTSVNPTPTPDPEEEKKKKKLPGMSALGLDQ